LIRQAAKLAAEDPDLRAWVIEERMNLPGVELDTYVALLR
jgi:hypothetical protein